MKLTKMEATPPPSRGGREESHSVLLKTVVFVRDGVYKAIPGGMFGSAPIYATECELVAKHPAFGSCAIHFVEQK